MIVSATVRALSPLGITELSLADVHTTLSAGTAATSIAAAVTIAIGPGRRMTARANRYQRPSVASGSGCRRASFMPHRPSSAGDTTSADAAATSATTAPAIPIDLRKPCGNSVSVASAQATVIAENTTVRPARDIVMPIASRTPAPPASSSRYRVTMNSE